MNDQVPCQWPQCPQLATRHIHHDLESIMVCAAHRMAVVVNIETHGKIWIFKENEHRAANAPIVRPGDQIPRKIGQPAPAPVATAAKPQDWQQDAARKADAAATPPAMGEDLVAPQRRTRGNTAASQVLGDSIKPN